MNSESNQSVFIVDDEPSVRRSIRLILETADHNCIEFESAIEFLDAFEPTNRGCIISDVRMPALDGMKFLGRLRAMGAKLPVVILTGHADVPMAVKAMKLGAADFLEKPVDPDELRRKVAKALSLEALAFQKNSEAAEIQALYSTLSPREAEVMELLISGKTAQTNSTDLGNRTKHDQNSKTEHSKEDAG